MEKIDEIIQQFSFLQNRHDHGLINPDEFLAKLRETATQLNDILWPKEKAQPVKSHR